MSRKGKLITAIGLPALAISLLGVGIASAHPSFLKNASPEEVEAHYTEMFEEKTELLGLSVDEMKTAWASGKTLADIASEQGISEDQLHTRMKEAGKAHMKTQLQTLVERGVITQTQADARLATMETRMEKMKANGHRGMGKFHHELF